MKSPELIPIDSIEANAVEHMIKKRGGVRGRVYEAIDLYFEKKEAKKKEAQKKA